MTREFEIVQASLKERNNSPDDFIKGALWADEHPIWNKQDEKDIYDSFNDWSYHRFVCLMKDGSIQVFTGICDEHDDGMVEKHINCSTSDHFYIDDINMWIEVPEVNK